MSIKNYKFKFKYKNKEEAALLASMLITATQLPLFGDVPFDGWWENGGKNYDHFVVSSDTVCGAGYASAESREVLFFPEQAKEIVEVLLHETTRVDVVVTVNGKNVDPSELSAETWNNLRNKACG